MRGILTRTKNGVSAWQHGLAMAMDERVSDSETGSSMAVARGLAQPALIGGVEKKGAWPLDITRTGSAVFFV